MAPAIGFSPERESRQAITAQRLHEICQLGSDNFTDNTTTLRVQRLSTLCGLAEQRASLVAGFVWGGGHG